MKWFLHHGKRAARIASGIVLIVIGLILSIPGVPGPGFLVIFAGISVLAIDFVWAHRLKTKLTDGASKVANKFRGKAPEPLSTRPKP